ncbi:large ribosomal subunit protein P2-like [Quercus suber]|uniref:large ribosomal subunit protein P2-like n=1 Tax=Quercus suber TaxID=58331 RepID=UPI0032DE8EC6
MKMRQKLDMPFIAPGGSVAGGGTRVGLFRTPIFGGVQSATSAHGLPRLALAVRNLTEQVPSKFVVAVALVAAVASSGAPAATAKEEEKKEKLAEESDDDMGFSLFD